MTVKCEQEKCSGQGQDEQFYCAKCNMELCSICRFEHNWCLSVVPDKEKIDEETAKSTFIGHQMMNSQCPNCKTELLQIPLEDKGIVKILQLQCPKCCLLTMYNVVSFDGKEYIISIPSKEK